MLDCLGDLTKHGFCVGYPHPISFSFDLLCPQREMPVFGLIHDHTVSGIIVSCNSGSECLFSDKRRMRFL